jgi:hypothetical protein
MNEQRAQLQKVTQALQRSCKDSDRQGDNKNIQTE